MEKQIIIIRPNSLSEADKEKLTQAGHIVIEHEKHQEVYFRPADAIEYTFTNCWNCGERIYLTKERLGALKAGKQGFYCSRGHANGYR